MKRPERRRLGIKRETLRRLAAGELDKVAGGRLGFCTYRVSGCLGGPTDDCTNVCWTDACATEDCGGDTSWCQ